MIRTDIIDRLHLPVWKNVRPKDYTPGWNQAEEFDELGKDVIEGW
jgi:hypothetical protein